MTSAILVTRGTGFTREPTVGFFVDPDLPVGNGTGGNGEALSGGIAIPPCEMPQMEGLETLLGCLCAARWREALQAGMVPRVVLNSTNEASLLIVGLDDLKRHAIDLN